MVKWILRNISRKHEARQQVSYDEYLLFRRRHLHESGLSRIFHEILFISGDAFTVMQDHLGNKLVALAFHLQVQVKNWHVVTTYQDNTDQTTVLNYQNTVCN